MSIRKLHAITTAIAVTSVFILIVFTVFNEFETWGLSLVPYWLGRFLDRFLRSFEKFAYGFGIMSVLLGLFRKAERD